MSIGWRKNLKVLNDYYNMFHIDKHLKILLDNNNLINWTTEVKEGMMKIQGNKLKLSYRYRYSNETDFIFEKGSLINLEVFMENYENINILVFSQSFIEKNVKKIISEYFYYKDEDLLEIKMDLSNEKIMLNITDYNEKWMDYDISEKKLILNSKINIPISELENNLKDYKEIENKINKFMEDRKYVI